jgi:hypothetical protein
MELPLYIYPVVAFLFLAVTFLALSRAQKHALLDRLGINRRPSRPSTPALEKQASSKPLASSTSDLASTFPPSQRDQLEKMRDAMPASQQKALGDMSFDQAKFERSLLDFEEDYETADESKYCYSGFSIKEIKALGDFPDFSALTEVPLPRPYDTFQIDKALPRPYRPLRWAYHQTMCSYLPRHIRQ